MSDWKDYQMAQERHQNLIRATARRQLLDEARAASARKPRRIGRITRIYGPMMVRVGGVLMHWGARLKAHYAALSDEMSKFGSTEAAERYIAAELDKALRKADDPKGSTATP
jgi:hypothetical protein